MVTRNLCLVWAFTAVAAGCMLFTPMAGLVNAAAAEEYEGPERVLRIGFMQPIDNLNPMMGLNDASYVFYGLIYDNPHCVDDNLEIVGNLVVGTRAVPVTDPEIADTGRPYGSIWEYDVTPNAMWHDGEPFTVDDFVWNMNMHSTYYDDMWAFQPYTFWMEKAVKVDEDTARIYYWNRDTEEPMASAFAYLLAIPMLPRHILSTWNIPDISFSWNGVFEGHSPPIVGTGPFMVTENVLSEWRAGDHITLVRNPNNHWKADKGEEIQFDKIIMSFYSDATSMRLALTANSIDIAQFPPETYKAIKDGINAGSSTYSNLFAYDGMKCTQYWTEIEFCMNNGGPNPSRLDPAIRQALATATNKTYIVNNFYRSLAEVGSVLIPSINEKWHCELSEDELFKFDLAEAASMLDEAGYRYLTPASTYRAATEDSFAVREKLVPLNKELRYDMLIRREYPEEALIARYLADTWATIGVGLNVIVVDETTMSKLVYSYEYDTCIWYWSADIDPNYMLFCQSKIAWAGWSDNKYYNESYEANYWASVSEMDYAQRKEYVDNCQRIHYEDAAWIVMAYPYQTYVWRTDTFEGWGDWAENPGRSMDSFWTANPLFFDLVYIGERETGFDVQSAMLASAVVAGIVAVAVALWWMKKRGKKKASPLGE